MGLYWFHIMLLYQTEQIKIICEHFGFILSQHSEQGGDIDLEILSKFIINF